MIINIISLCFLVGGRMDHFHVLVLLPQSFLMSKLFLGTMAEKRGSCIWILVCTYELGKLGKKLELVVCVISLGSVIKEQGLAVDYRALVPTAGG